MKGKLFWTAKISQVSGVSLAICRSSLHCFLGERYWKMFCLGRSLHGKTDQDKALEMIEKAGLAGYEHSLPSALSGGMKQRVAFIRALLSPHSLICLDEPFSALDDFTRLEMQQWLMTIWTEYRRTILFVTHNIEEALFLSDRIIVLSANPAKHH